jgi:AcrR family transcriptional regulator
MAPLPTRAGRHEVAGLLETDEDRDHGSLLWSGLLLAFAHGTVWYRRSRYGTSARGFFVRKASARDRASGRRGARRGRKTIEPQAAPGPEAARTPLRERVLNAAFAAFMEKGYAGTSTLEIATRAKVSKRELYQVCPGKSGLLREAITERARRMRVALEIPPAADRAGLAATLTALGTGVLRGVCDPPVRAVYWLAIAESAQAPEVGQALQGERSAGRAALSRRLAQAQADGLIGAGDPAAMAVDFFALLWGDLLLQLLLRVTEPPSAAALERKARAAADKFLRLYPPP